LAIFLFKRQAGGQRGKKSLPDFEKHVHWPHASWSWQGWRMRRLPPRRQFRTSTRRTPCNCPNP
jgi:hypothetical protein